MGLLNRMKEPVIKINNRNSKSQQEKHSDFESLHNIEEQIIKRLDTNCLDVIQGDSNNQFSQKVEGMTPLFSNKSTNTKQNFIEVVRKTSPHNYLLTIIFSFYGLIFFIGGLMYKEYFMCLLGVSFVIIFLLFPLRAVQSTATNMYQQSIQLYNNEVESVTSFYEDRFVFHNINNESDIIVAYPKVAKVYETKKLFFLMLSTRVGFILEKKGFVGMTSDEFNRFIRARAVGEGKTELKKKKRKNAIITATIILFFTIAALTMSIWN